MANLESTIGNFGKGFLTGISKIADPVGYGFSKIDYVATGIGYSEGNSIDTIHNAAYKAVYRKPEDPVSFKKGYVPRIAGNLAGFVGGAIGLGSLYLTLGPVAALAAPAIFGVYGAINFIRDYGKGFLKKPEQGERKASFSDGFKYGWHSGSNYILKLLHYTASNYNGRGVDQSSINSSMKHSAGKMKSRSFGGISGRIVGGLLGTVVSVASLGIVPLYKTIRDTMRARDPQAVAA